MRRDVLVGAALGVAVYIAGIYTWEFIRARFFPGLPPLGSVS